MACWRLPRLPRQPGALRRRRAPPTLLSRRPCIASADARSAGYENRLVPSFDSKQCLNRNASARLTQERFAPMQVLRDDVPEFITPEEFGRLSAPQRRQLFAEYYIWQGDEGDGGEQRVTTKSDNGHWLFTKLCGPEAAAAAKAAKAIAAAGAAE